MTTSERLLPTPSAEFTDIPDRETWQARREREKKKHRNGNGFGLTLPMAISQQATSDATSSPAASPARDSQAPETEQDSAIPKLCFGGSSYDSFAHFDPVTASSKTSQLSLDFTEESASTKSCPVWPRAGTQLGGTYYQRQPLARLTAGNGSLLLPTPRSSANEQRQMKRTPSQEAGTHGRSLAAEVGELLPTPTGHERTHTPRQVDHGRQLANEVNNLMPTPTSAAYEQGGTGADATAIRRGIGLLPTPNSDDTRPTDQPESEEKRQARLSDSVRALLPTPRVLDARHAAATENELKRRPEWDLLHVKAARLAGSTGASTAKQLSDGKPSSGGQRLSPYLTEWMMGLPHGFTDPDCLLSATEFKSRLRNCSGE